MALRIVILAAGQGKRMNSNLPKVLHPLAGKPLLEHVVASAKALNPAAIYVVYGYRGEEVRKQMNALPVEWIEQVTQLGTGHAVAQVLPYVDDQDQVLVLVGDTPLIKPKTLEKLLTASNQGVGLITVHLSNPAGLGRILRTTEGKVCGVVEDKDASPEQRALQEINTGLITAPAKYLKRWLPTLSNQNTQSEYYLPDIIKMAVSEGLDIITVTAESSFEVQGINDRAQLACLERYQQQQLAKQLMFSGVMVLDPARLDIRGDLHAEKDVTLDINVIIEGKVTIGENTVIGPNTILRDVRIGKNVLIKANTIIEEAEIADGCIIGPFARIRPGTKLDANVHIGNFVEVKKSLIGVATKINHLSYIGDATIGSEVNIGAGTITCNYDGVNKHQTTIEDRVFIGSDTQLIAPVKIGHDAIIAAGSTVIRDAPAASLTLTQRLDQRAVSAKPSAKKKQ